MLKLFIILAELFVIHFRIANKNNKSLLVDLGVDA